MANNVSSVWLEKNADLALSVRGRLIFCNRVVLDNTDTIYAHLDKVGVASEAGDTRGLGYAHKLDADVDAVYNALDFIYGRAYDIDEYNVDDVNQVALQLYNPDLIALCAKIRGDRAIGPRFALRALSVLSEPLRSGPAQQYYAMLKMVVLRNVDYALRNDLFSGVDVDLFAELMRDDELNVADEYDVMEAVVAWINADVTDRKRHFSRLLSVVRLERLDRKRLVKGVYVDPLIADDAGLKAILERSWEDSFARGVSLYRGTPLHLPKHLTETRPRIARSVVFSFGGWSDGNARDHAESYDICADEWFVGDARVTPPFRAAYHAATVADTVIWVTGGVSEIGELLNTTYAFRVTGKAWSSMATMRYARCSHCAVFLSGRVYAMGGQMELFIGEGRSTAKNCEYYDVISNSWMEFTRMNRYRCDAGATTHNGYIYIAGGDDGRNNLSSMEIYDPKSDQWTYAERLDLGPRTGLSLVSSGDFLYAVGGHIGGRRLTRLERYCPIENAWEQMRPFNKGRSNFGATVIDNKIIINGGFNGYTFCKYTDQYDIKLNKWSLLANCNIGKVGHSLLTVHDIGNIRDFTYYGHSKKRETGRTLYINKIKANQVLADVLSGKTNIDQLSSAFNNEHSNGAL